MRISKKTEEFAGFEVLEYFDDGYSGTMFNNRAEFQRLIQDAELGRFECIIVKDFHDLEGITLK